MQGIFSGEAIDVVNNHKYTYPKSNKDMLGVKVKYDFIFSKGDLWFYMSSADDFNTFTSDEFQLHVLIENANEEWKVVDAKTGEIMLEGGFKIIQ